MRTGYEKHTLSNAAIWYGLTTSCISISKLKQYGTRPALSSFFPFLISLQLFCNVKRKLYTCNCHFLQALTPPQVMIYKYEKITICFSKDTYSFLWTSQFLLLIYAFLILSKMLVSLFSSCSQ